ncbi:MAG: hypothetical protein CFE35_18810 [Novosphingobium sp. PASSN1]|nr:MAG: hypothetical protein CFE35_18810 [Novosphingobium sp. PASSN1]
MQLLLLNARLALHLKRLSFHLPSLKLHLLALTLHLLTLLFCKITLLLTLSFLLNAILITCPSESALEFVVAYAGHDAIGVSSVRHR